MGYFKLTSAVNAGIIFFMLFFSDDKNKPVVLALEIVTGIDIGFNLIQMGFGFAGFNVQRLCAKGSSHDRSSPPPVYNGTAPTTSTAKSKRK